MASRSNSSNAFKICTNVALLALLVVVQKCADCTQIRAVVEHDLSGPTFGLEGKSGSAMQYDDRNGLNMKGTINNLLGPPIKIANGFGNIHKGYNLEGMGHSLKSGGALLGFDAKILETAGMGNLLKGGLLMGGANYKTNAAGQLAGTKGQKIASIIEVPVKVVAMKDLATGKVLTGLAHVKQTKAQAMNSKGQALYNQGQALKKEGLNQIIQGAHEGVDNLGQMAQKTSEQFNSAYKLLPIVWESQQQQQIEQVQQEDAAKGQQQVQHLMSKPYQLSSSNAGPVTGGSLFGGLSSLLPGLNSNGVGPGMAPNPGYAALWNSTNPLTNLLTNPAANPFLFPLAIGPLGQAFAAKQPIGTPEAQAANANHDGSKGSASAPTTTFDFNLFPGLKYKESFSSSMPKFDYVEKFPTKQQHPQQQHVVQQVIQQTDIPQEGIKQQTVQQQDVPQQQQQQQQQQVTAHQAGQETQPKSN